MHFINTAGYNPRVIIHVLGGLIPLCQTIWVQKMKHPSIPRHPTNRRTHISFRRWIVAKPSQVPRAEVAALPIISLRLCSELPAT